MRKRDSNGYDWVLKYFKLNPKDNHTIHFYDLRTPLPSLDKLNITHEDVRNIIPKIDSN
jgi:hypothetical protein